MTTELLDWDVAVYCVNEADRLRGCLDSLAVALAGRRAVITVILNGSRDRSLEIARAAARDGAPVRIFRIEVADKSNAINQFYYTLRAPARACAGVDGYAFIGPASFRAMEERLNTDPHALAVYLENWRSGGRFTFFFDSKNSIRKNCIKSHDGGPSETSISLPIFLLSIQFYYSHVLLHCKIFLLKMAYVAQKLGDRWPFYFF